MAKRQFQLSEGETGQVRAHEEQTEKVAELKRLQAVRLYGCGQSMAGIKDMTGCAESSIREWVQDYKRDGLASLRAHYEQSAQNATSDFAMRLLAADIEYARSALDDEPGWVVARVAGVGHYRTAWISEVRHGATGEMIW